MDPGISESEIAARLKREHAVSPMRGHETEEQSPFRNYVRDLVLGLNDGVVSVFAVVAGLVGAGLASGVVALAGIAALVAGALSMGIGEYVSTKAQAEYYESERRREREHIRKYPDIEATELREYMEARGFSGDLLDRVMATLTANEERFLDTMMREEFGMGAEVQRSPLLSMGLIMVAFVVGAAPAVVPFLLVGDSIAALAVAGVLSFGVLFIGGAIRGAVSGLSMVKGGAEMLALGAAAAAVTYGIGTIVGVAV